MRRLLLIGLLLPCACTSAPPPQPTVSAQPPYLGNGSGSQFGNYEDSPTGEWHQGPNGPCPISAWDRPISNGRLIRYLSAACPAPMPGRPDAVKIIDLGRQVINP